MFGVFACVVGGCGLQPPTVSGGGSVVAVAADAGEETPPAPLGDDVVSEAEPVPLPPQGVHEAPSPDIFGTWLLDGGAMLTTFVSGVEVTAMILNEDGSGRVFLFDGQTGTRDCVQTYNVFDGETLVLDFSADPNLALGVERFFTFPVVVVVVDHGALGVADEAGQIAWFSRQSALPQELTCGRLEIQRTFENVPAPSFFSDLVPFDGDLVYNSQDGLIERFDLNTNRLGVPLGSTAGRLVQTVQGNHFWTHCACGGSPDAFRRDLNTVFDTVSTPNELGDFQTIRAMAYDSVDDRLWLHGRLQSTGLASFSIVDTNGEPDVLVQSIPFNRELRALAFDGTDMWGVVTMASQSVVRVNAVTGEVLESFEVPDEAVVWSGLTFDPFHMYMLGTDPAGAGVIARIRRP